MPSVTLKRKRSKLGLKKNFDVPKLNIGMSFFKQADSIDSTGDTREYETTLMHESPKGRKMSEGDDETTALDQSNDSREPSRLNKDKVLKDDSGRPSHDRSDRDYGNDVLRDVHRQGEPQKTLRGNLQINLTRRGLAVLACNLRTAGLFQKVKEWFGGGVPEADIPEWDLENISKDLSTEARDILAVIYNQGKGQPVEYGPKQILGNPDLSVSLAELAKEKLINIRMGPVTVTLNKPGLQLGEYLESERGRYIEEQERERVREVGEEKETEVLDIQGEELNRIYRTITTANKKIAAKYSPNDTMLNFLEYLSETKEDFIFDTKLLELHPLWNVIKEAEEYRYVTLEPYESATWVEITDRGREVAEEKKTGEPIEIKPTSDEELETILGYVSSPGLSYKQEVQPILDLLPETLSTRTAGMPTPEEVFGRLPLVKFLIMMLGRREPLIVSDEQIEKNPELSNFLDSAASYLNVDFPFENLTEYSGLNLDGYRFLSSALNNLLRFYDPEVSDNVLEGLREVIREPTETPVREPGLKGFVSNEIPVEVWQDESGRWVYHDPFDKTNPLKYVGRGIEEVPYGTSVGISIDEEGNEYTLTRAEEGKAIYKYEPYREKWEQYKFPRYKVLPEEELGLKPEEELSQWTGAYPWEKTSIRKNKMDNNRIKNYYTIKDMELVAPRIASVMKNRGIWKVDKEIFDEEFDAHFRKQETSKSKKNGNFNPILSIKKTKLIKQKAKHNYKLSDDYRKEDLVEYYDNWDVEWILYKASDYNKKGAKLGEYKSANDARQVANTSGDGNYVIEGKALRDDSYWGYYVVSVRNGKTTRYQKKYVQPMESGIIHKARLMSKNMTQSDFLAETAMTGRYVRARLTKRGSNSLKSLYKSQLKVLENIAVGVKQFPNKEDRKVMRSILENIEENLDALEAMTGVVDEADKQERHEVEEELEEATGMDVDEDAEVGEPEEHKEKMMESASEFEKAMEYED